jgi:hypothetical protein
VDEVAFQPRLPDCTTNNVYVQKLFTLHPLEIWTFVSCECLVLSGIKLRDEPIRSSNPDVFYCVCLCV